MNVFSWKYFFFWLLKKSLNFLLSLSGLFFPQLEAELALCEREGAELQEYANQVLQQIADRCPDILEQVVNALEDSCWHTNAHTLAENDFFFKKSLHSNI